MSFTGASHPGPHQPPLDANPGSLAHSFETRLEEHTMASRAINLDTRPGVAFDAVGVFWSVLAIVWTGVLAAGMIFLWRKRDMPHLRIRSLPLSMGAVLMLHTYWLCVTLGYVYGALMPTAIEFWIMSIWLPFGIGLFQASNSQFLYVSNAQKKFVRPDSVGSSRSGLTEKLGTAKDTSLLTRFKKLDYPRRMLAYVCTGMVVQFFLTLIMFLVSRKFHDGFGAPGTEVTGTPEEKKAQQAVGWEWWPSIFWQMAWAWIIAPIILWKSRRIHDTHGWRLQTIACCLASLHSSPMWLIALYVPAMAPVNEYFIPPQWIAVSIMIMAFFTIILPCIQTLRHQTLQQETLDSIARWEARNKSVTSADSVADSWRSLAGVPATNRTHSVYSNADSVLVIGALEYVLEKNPEPLRQFSALKDFSGENIAFLMNVAEWKCLPENARIGPGDADILPDVRREKFTRGLRIYHDFVSPRWAEFPLNISSAERRGAELVFDDAARLLFGSEHVADPVAPFSGPDTSATELTARESFGESGEKNGQPMESFIDRILYWGDIPDDFSMNIFDEIETSIKHLVLTNTWPKFVKERRTSWDSQRTQSV